MLSAFYAEKLLRTPLYQGFSAIGCCHFQHIANILASQGLLDARRRIGLSWGFGWSGNDGILWGADRWIERCNEAYGTDMQQLSFSTWEEAMMVEQSLLARGIPFVAEVDRYELFIGPQPKEHFIHSVIVLAKANGMVKILDVTSNPVPTDYHEEIYNRMRVSPCVGRVQPYQLYVSMPVVLQPVSMGRVIKLFRMAFEAHWATDLARFEAFITWAAAQSAPLTVWRVAAERLQLTQLFEWFAGFAPALGHFGTHFATLSELWYLLHMLTTSEQTTQRAQRPRMVRLLRSLYTQEATLATEIQGVLAEVEQNSDEQHGRRAGYGSDGTRDP